ncbi:MAG: benzoyl-CoA-dihydrodiol lyase [Polyangiaceae bacterium]|nr:benzoyl-CoA-dihydrodiol lyase [Polyangiaceae bacterium]
MEPIRFETHPDRYRHWKLSFDGATAKLDLDIPEDGGLVPGYVLKQNSYDLGVDIELADAIQRIRFEHPETKCVVIAGTKDRVFCSGANIYMLGSSTHAFKVNFCKFTNETRLYLEDMTDNSGIHTVAALGGACAGGGYELAMACERILLLDDGSSAVSLPEVPLLGVLPGTGGLTRLVDKRKVRRDLADAFSTVAEGVRGKRAVEWGLVDAVAKKSNFDEALAKLTTQFCAETAERSGPAVTLKPLSPTREENATRYEYVSLEIDEEKRVANLKVSGPKADTPEDAKALRELGSDVWALKAFRELDDAILDLRFNERQIGLIVLTTEGDAERVLQSDRTIQKLAESDWFAKEILLHMKRVLKRLDLSARTVFAIADQGTCFAGSLFELLIAADRSFMLDVEDGPTLRLSALNFGPLPMGNGLSRLESRFFGTPGRVAELKEESDAIDTERAAELGLVTFTPDDIDWEDEVRIAIEERAAFSPDALTGMEASLRFVGPETLETKIFGRLSAWQNWIFQRPNAVGDRGGLTTYGTPERPKFNYERT